MHNCGKIWKNQVLSGHDEFNYETSASQNFHIAVNFPCDTLDDFFSELLDLQRSNENLMIELTKKDEQLTKKAEELTKKDEENKRLKEQLKKYTN